MLKASILRIMICLFIVSSRAIQTEMANSHHSYIVYSPEQMQEHKRKCTERMSSNPSNLKDLTYQMQRALKTVLGDDADYIPKVVGAGEIFYDEAVPYQLMHNGVKIILNSYYDVQWLTDVIYALKGHHEPQEEKCFHEPNAQIYNAPRVTVINNFSLNVEIDIDMHQGSHA